MKKKHFEDSITSRIVVNLIDIVLLCASFLVTYLVSLYLKPDSVKTSEVWQYDIIAMLCYAPVAFLFPPIVLRRVCSSDKIAGNVFLTSACHFVFFLLVTFLLKMATKKLTTVAMMRPISSMYRVRPMVERSFLTQ